MGGDFAPDVVVEGVCKASSIVGSDTEIVLFGDRERIEAKLENLGVAKDKFEIVHTSQVIDMNDSPAQAFIKKPDSSIAVGFGYLMKGKIDGFASAGSTGAMLVGCMYTVKQIEGVIRPTIASEIPSIPETNTLLLDVGLNIDCKPEMLYQYGIFGSVYATAVMGVENPRVALLNIGEEKEKGNAQTKAAYALMEGTTEFNFVGNVESKHMFTGKVADVVVCDGFMGNALLKQAEGVYHALRDRSDLPQLITEFNYEIEGGTPVLGINSNVIIGHGCSSARAIKNMTLKTEKTVRSQLVEKIRERFANEKK